MQHDAILRVRVRSEILEELHKRYGARGISAAIRPYLEEMVNRDKSPKPKKAEVVESVVERKEPVRTHAMNPVMEAFLKKHGGK